MRKMIPSLMLILLYGTAGANGGTFVMGAGGKPCGEILKEDRAARVYSIFWIQGYLSGINSYVRANSIDQTNLMVDYDTIDIWIENYCRTNPLDSLHNAAWSLGGALYARTRSADSDRNK